MTGNTDGAGRLKRALDSLTGNLALTAGALIGVSLAVLLVDQVALWLLGSADVQAKQTLVVAVFNLFLIVAYVGLVITNREQLSSMEDQVELLRVEFEPDVAGHNFKFDGDEVSVTFKNRGDGIAFSPTLTAQAEKQGKELVSAKCLPVDDTDVESQRVLKPGSQVTRTYEFQLPTDSGMKPFRKTVGPNNLRISRQFISALLLTQH